MDDDLFARLEAAMGRVEAQAGLDPSDLLALPDDVRRLVQAIARQPDLTAAELAGATGLPEADLPDLLAALVAKGLVERRGDGGDGGDESRGPATGARAPAAADRGGPRYRVAFGRRRTRELPIDLWALLDDRTRG